MFIPIKTDATKYYHPFGTLGVIAANVVILFLVGPVQRESFWILQFGAFAPWQWITSAFNHAGIFHLFWNMLFLWFFGQIVEGRLGWPRFLALYLAMAATEGLIVQTFMLGSGPVEPGHGALGASGVVYGLMVVAFFWAPEEKVSCVFVFAFRARLVDCPVGWFAVFYIGLDLLFGFFTGFSMGTSVLHLIGALAGLAPAIFLPRTGWVYLGEWKGLLAPPPFRMLESDEEDRPPEPEAARVEAVPHPPTPPPPPTDEEKVDRAEDLTREERPRKALEALVGIDHDRLSLADRARYDQIVAVARRQIDEGVIELD